MAATRIIVLFSLKAGKDRQAYEAWARTSDLPIVNGLGSIDRFSVHAATGLLGSDAAPPYEYIEIIDVADMDAFDRDVASETMQQVAREFQDWADPVFIVTREIA